MIRDLNIRAAAVVLRSGGMVAFPTDTVYGLGADAFNESAVKRIFSAKNRNKDHGLPVLISQIDQIKQLVNKLSKSEEKLIKHFWPGALTIVFNRHSKVPNIVSGGSDTIAVRMPSSEVALNLIEEFGGPIVGTSANRSGFSEAVSAEQAESEIGTWLDYLIPSDEICSGTPSTILDMTTSPPRILREGGVTAEEIFDFLGISSNDNQDEPQPVS
ncbi:MAG: L-threonylcarbamoyladenylate synthase [Dehalococcoidia bacterium]